jgi:hypothetical protein
MGDSTTDLHTPRRGIEGSIAAHARQSDRLQSKVGTNLLGDFVSRHETPESSWKHLLAICHDTTAVLF